MKKAFIISLLALLFTSCKKEPVTKQVTWEYRYEVYGSGSNDFSITLQNTDGNTQQWASVGSGWWYKWNQTLTVDQDNQPINDSYMRWLYISAQDNSGSAGSVTVKIIRNGSVVNQNTSYGPFTIATAKGTY